MLAKGRTPVIPTKIGTLIGKDGLGKVRSRKFAPDHNPASVILTFVRITGRGLV
jgi:hypothetical protein